jgi:hypothetical protein
LVDGNKTDQVNAMVAAIQKADALEWAVFDTDDTTKNDRALALEPRLMIQPRAAKLADVAPLLAKYASHVPVFVEITSIFPMGATHVHAAGTRPQRLVQRAGRARHIARGRRGRYVTYTTIVEIDSVVNGNAG